MSGDERHLESKVVPSVLCLVCSYPVLKFDLLAKIHLLQKVYDIG